ncbi:MAG: YkgJ family cysteine cluster protein [Oscillospiraceae bacterium]|nr:YkgJ family cysteine cluster protein [Oscillospiraceae bacterium]
MVKEYTVTPENVNKLGKSKEEENLKFRVFLKNNADSDKLDKQFKELHEKLFNNYDCIKCNNCCKEYNITFSENDIAKNAELFNMSKKEFIDKYLVLKNDEFEIKNKPCDFLSKDGICMIHNTKPKECAEYPYTDKNERLFSLYSIIESTKICPVVYEIVESLKEMYGFKIKR